MPNPHRRRGEFSSAGGVGGSVGGFDPDVPGLDAVNFAHALMNSVSGAPFGASGVPINRVFLQPFESSRGIEFRVENLRIMETRPTFSAYLAYSVPGKADYNWGSQDTYPMARVAFFPGKVSVLTPGMQDVPATYDAGILFAGGDTPHSNGFVDAPCKYLQGRVTIHPHTKSGRVGVHYILF